MDFFNKLDKLNFLNNDEHAKAKKNVLILLLLIFIFSFSLLLPFVRNLIIEIVQKLMHQQLENPKLWHNRLILTSFLMLFYDIAAIFICFNFTKKTLSFQNVFIACIFSAFVFTNCIFIVNNCFKLDWMIIYDFTDILMIKGYASHYCNFYNSNYPPVAIAIYKFFNYFLPPNIDFGDLKFISIEENIELYLTSLSAVNHVLMMFVFSSTLLLFFSLFKSFNGKETKRYLLTSIFFLTGPFIYALQRGNVVIYSIAFTLLFVKYYKDERTWTKELALLSLALAANIKLYPAIFGFLLIKNKDYKAALRCALYGIILFILPAIILGQNPITSTQTYIKTISSWSGAMENALENTTATVENTIIENETALSSVNSTISANSEVSVSSVSSTPGFTMNRLTKGIIILVLGLLLTFIAKNEYQTLLFLSSMCLLIPTPSYYYNLVFLFVPLVPLLNKAKINIAEKISSTLFIFCMIYDIGILKCHPSTRWHLYTLIAVNIVFVIIDFFISKKHCKAA